MPTSNRTSIHLPRSIVGVRASITRRREQLSVAVTKVASGVAKQFVPLVGLGSAAAFSYLLVGGKGLPPPEGKQREMYGMKIALGAVLGALTGAGVYLLRKVPRQLLERVLNRPEIAYAVAVSTPTSTAAPDRQIEMAIRRVTLPEGPTSTERASGGNNSDDDLSLDPVHSRTSPSHLRGPGRT